MKTLRKYSKQNIHIVITDFRLMDISFYGCDAMFDFEIRDNETNVLLDVDCEIIENAFAGVDDSEDLYYFLEDKDIDFSQEYDDDYDRLPEELKQEFQDYEMELYGDMYHENFFEEDDKTQQEVIKKIMAKLYLDTSKFYIVYGQEVKWIQASFDYTGVHLSSDNVKIGKVYNVDMEGYIYECGGIYFAVNANDFSFSTDFYIVFFERDDNHPFTVTADDLDNDRYPGYQGKVNDVVYNYREL